MAIDATAPRSLTQTLAAGFSLGLEVFPWVRKRNEARRQAEEAEDLERYRNISNALPHIVWTATRDGHLDYFNEQFYAYTGLSVKDATAELGWTQIVHPLDLQRSLDLWTAATQSGESFECEYRLRDAEGDYRWHIVRARAIKDRRGRVLKWFGTCTDIDEQKRAEDRIRFLDEASSVMTNTLNHKVVLQSLAHLCVPEVADIAIVDYTDDEGETMTPLSIAHRDPVKADTVRFMRERWPRTRPFSGQPEFYQAIPAAQLTQWAADPEHLKILQGLDLFSAIVVPLKARDRIMGSLTCIRTCDEEPYDQRDFSMITEVAQRAAIIADNARLYEHEHRVANQLQQAFLPQHLPQVPGIHFHSSYLPAAKENEVGGDWYDTFVLPDGKIAIAIGDVAGHGLESAVIMGEVRQAIRAVALEDPEPSIVLERVNRLLHLHDGEPVMVTAIFAVLDPVTLELNYANAGHPVPIIVVLPDGDVRELEGGGVPLGVITDSIVHTQQIILPQGCLMVLYTDGLIEMERDVLAGTQKLIEAVRAEALAGSPNPAIGIQKRLVSNGEASDDIAILTAFIPQQAVTELNLTLQATPANSPVTRQALRRLMTGLNVDDFKAPDIFLAVGEAVNNAIEHAYLAGSGSFQLRAKAVPTADDLELRIEIQDHGEWRAPREEGRGRGMMLMQELSKSLKVENNPDGTKVTLVFSIKPSTNLFQTAP